MSEVRNSSLHRSLTTLFSSRQSLAPLAGLLAIASALVVAPACSGTEEVPPDLSVGLGGSRSTDLEGPCEDGTTKSCSITFEQSNGIISCFRGVKRCEAGGWSECREGTITKEADPTWAGYDSIRERQGLSLNPPSKCDTNPCDPSCQWFDEDPDDIGIGGASSTGTVPDLGGCDHGLCEKGAGLDASCDSCVASVCALDSSCCDTSDPAAWDATCSALVAPVCTASAPSLQLCDFAALANTSLTLAQSSVVNAGALGATTLSAQQTAAAGDFLGATSVTLDGGSYSGFAYASGSVSLQNGATLPNNGSHSGVSVALPSIPTRSLSCIAASGSTKSVGSGIRVVSPGNADTWTVDQADSVLLLDGPGNYGSITFSASGTLVFKSAGTYSFDSLSIGASTPKVLFPSAQSVEVNTCSNLSFSNSATVNTYSTSTNPCLSYDAWDNSLYYYGTGKLVVHNSVAYQATADNDPHTASTEPGVGSSWTSKWKRLGQCVAYSYSASGATPEPLDLRWYTNSTGTVSLGTSSNTSGIVIAPQATVTTGGGTHHGLIYANTISTSTGFQLDSSSSVGNACVQAGIAASSADICAVDVLVPLLNEPCVTGRNCQGNHRCEQPTTGSSCDHSKCEPGAPLDSGCDECVERICDVSPECCNDEWDSSCIAQVASVCDAVCDDYSCLHQACDTGVPLQKSCNSCVQTVCNTPGFEDCCTDNWSFKCVQEFRDECGAPPVVTPPTSGGSICDYSAYGRFELNAQYSTLKGGWVGSPSNSSMNISYSDIYGNVTTSASLNGTGGDVYGNFVTGGSGSIVGPTVHGSLVTTLPPEPTLPNKSFTCTDSSTQTLSGVLQPGTYGNVTVADGQTLTLKAGTYIFNSLTIGTGGGGATLQFPSDGSIVEINVCGNVSFGQNSIMSGLTQATSMYGSIYTKGYFSAVGNNTLYGFIIAPSNNGWSSGPCSSGTCDLTLMRPGFIYLGDDTKLYGLVGAGRRVDTRKNVLIDSTGVRDSCQLIWDPGTTVTYPACPVTLTADPADESGTCSPNSIGYQDATCSGYDLALGIPCDDQVFVCNHGTSDFSGNVEVGYWDAAEGQLSTPSPISPDGICSASLSIPKGDCAALTCASLPTTDLTMMVDPEEKLSECDTRRLDNWTAHDGRECILDSRTEVYRYEAVCPANTAPSWGYLAYNTTTPGNSTVSFEGVSAFLETDIPSAPAYTTLAIAQSSVIPQTQNCGLASGCKIDLTDAFKLGENQPAWIELSVTLQADGSDQPVLHDWKLTYSCIYDQ